MFHIWNWVLAFDEEKRFQVNRPWEVQVTNVTTKLTLWFMFPKYKQDIWKKKIISITQKLSFWKAFFLKFQEHLFFHVKKQKGFLSLKNNCSRSIRYWFYVRPIHFLIERAVTLQSFKWSQILLEHFSIWGAGIVVYQIKPQLCSVDTPCQSHWSRGSTCSLAPC